MKNILKLLLIQLGLAGLIFSLNATDPYEYLSGISEDTTITPDMELSEKNKACRKFALEYHPDKHQAGDKARFEKLFINISSACDAIKEDRKDFKLPYEFVDEQLKTMADLPGFREHLSQVAEELKRNFEPLFAEAKRKNQRMPLEALQEFHELWDKPIGSDTSLRVGTFLIILNAPGLDFFIEHNLIDPTKPITINTSTITPDQLAAKAGHFDLAYKFRKHAAEQQKQKTNQPQSKNLEPQTKPTQEPTKQVVDTSSVSNLNLAANIDLTMTVDPSKPFNATLTGSEEALKDIVMEVTNNALSIRSKSENYSFSGGTQHKSTKPVKAIINVPQITNLNISGTVNGTVSCKNRTGDKLLLNISGVVNVSVFDIKQRATGLRLSGSGSLVITGSTQDLDINSSGTINVAAKKLTAQTAHVNASGTGNLELLVDKQLTGRCSGTSNITNFGRAAADVRNSGVCSIKDNSGKKKNRSRDDWEF